jgi:Fe(II)/alpha-ketoglutarate-dependent arginine beta-hydroxylase
VKKTVPEVAPEPLTPGSDGQPSRFVVTGPEAGMIRELAAELAILPAGVPLESLLSRAAVLAQELPRRLREVVTGFRLTDRPYGGFVLGGLPVDEPALGPTPASYTEPVDRAAVRQAEMTLLLLGSLLGDPFSFITQQRGQLILDVFPVRGHEHEQLGSSSRVTLEWHNEDAFHNARADWSVLLCLRNPYGAATTFAPIDTVGLPEDVRDVLFQERFTIMPDVSHTQGFNAATAGVEDGQQAAFGVINQMKTEPRRIAVLSGDREAPFVRIDPAFMRQDDTDREARDALTAARAAIDEALREVVLAPGELFIIDNLRAVHGRAPFRARYDGTDRWLKRINLTADLRKTAGSRLGPGNRALI